MGSHGVRHDWSDLAAAAGIYSQELKTYAHTKNYTQMIIVVLLIRVKKWQQPKCPLTDKYKQNVV